MSFRPCLICPLTYLVYLQFTGMQHDSPTTLNAKLCFQLFAQETSTISSYPLLLVLNFLGMLPCWNSISAGPLQPLPVLSLHFSYGARQPSTFLSYVTSAWHCMVLPSLTGMPVWPTEVSHCYLSQKNYLIFVLMCTFKDTNQGNSSNSLYFQICTKNMCVMKKICWMTVLWIDQFTLICIVMVL